MPSRNPLVGREALLNQLNEVVANPTVKVLHLVGPSGVGKTALANRLLEKALRFGDRRYRQVMFSMTGDADRTLGLSLVVSSMVNALSPGYPRNKRLDEQQEELFRLIKDQQTPVLLLLDNVESMPQQTLSEFIDNWLKHSTASMLLLTGTNPEPLAPDSQAFVREVVGGLNDKDALAVLGNDFVAMFGQDPTLEMASNLQGHPQHLIYLRTMTAAAPDRQPKERLADALRLVEELRSAPDRDMSGRILERLTSGLRGPFHHFVALGRACSLEVDEKLLAWLWDVLGAGSALAFHAARDELVDAGLLVKEGGSFRVNASVHIELDRFLHEHLGATHVGHIEYYLSEHYRQRLLHSERRRKDLDVEALAFYVHHSIRSSNLVSATDFLLARGRLRYLHFSGFAHQVRQAFEGLLKGIEARIDELEPNSARPGGAAPDLPFLCAQRIGVLIEIAHCHTDLSNHQDALRVLEQAKRHLNGWPSTKAGRFKQEIDYLEGVSYSRIGQPDKCIQSYIRVVDRAVREERLAERALLALNYMAFESRFLDDEIAVQLGHRAADLAARRGDAALEAKARCSLAQSLFFAGKIDASREEFHAALRLVSAQGDLDRRELGRILIHSSMILIKEGNFDRAKRQLDDAEDQSTSNRDRRREASARALRSICLFRGTQKEQSKAMAGLVEALEQHRLAKDWRNAVPEALTYAWMERIPSHLIVAQAQSVGEHSWAATLREVPEAALKVFYKFWDQKFRPHLLES